MPTVETTLYFANWCGHCHSFMKEWDEFATMVNSEKKINGIKVIANKYEESSFSTNKPSINETPVRGYPTVKISVSDDNGNSVEYEYNGKRTSEALISHIKNNSLSNIRNINATNGSNTTNAKIVKKKKSLSDSV